MKYKQRTIEPGDILSWAQKCQGLVLYLFPVSFKYVEESLLVNIVS